MRQSIMGCHLFCAPPQPLPQVRHAPPKTLLYRLLGFHLNALGSAALLIKRPDLTRQGTRVQPRFKSRLTGLRAVILYTLTRSHNKTIKNFATRSRWRSADRSLISRPPPLRCEASSPGIALI